MRTNVFVGCSALASSGGGAVVVSGVVVALFSVVFSAVSSGASLLSPESPPAQLAKRSKEASNGVKAAAIESLIGGGLYMVLPEASKFPRTRHTGSPVSENAPYETVWKIALRVWNRCFWWCKAAMRALLPSFYRLLGPPSEAHADFPNSFSRKPGE